jgi:hypothetical protein
MLVDLASTRLKLSIDDPHGHDAPIRYIAELRKYFQSNPGCLLVLDNVEDPRQLAGDRLIPGIEPTTILSMGSSVLFTSRQRFDLPGVSWRRVGILPEAEATRLLTTGRDPASQSEIAASKEICNAVGYLPLALVLANGFLRDAQSVSYREYRESLSRDLLGTVDLAKMSEEELATRHVAAIEKTLDVQLANLERDALALLLIKMCSFFGDAEMVPRELLENAGTGIRPPGIERPFDRAIHRLLSGNLLEEFADRDRETHQPRRRTADQAGSGRAIQDGLRRFSDVRTDVSEERHRSSAF